MEPQFYIPVPGFPRDPAFKGSQRLFRNFRVEPLGGDPGKDLPLSKPEVFICRMDCPEPYSVERCQVSPRTES